MALDRAPQDRPAFPAEAAVWLAGCAPRSVVACGHRNLTTDLIAALEALGHDVADLHGAVSTLPFVDSSVDVVVCAQGLPANLDEVARVLRPGGQLALVWNQRDHRIPWARKLDRALCNPEPPEQPALAIITSTRFGFVDEASYRYWQVVNHDSLAELVRAELADRRPEERERRVAAALELYDDYGRGADGMQMPWLSRCFRATVVESAWATPTPSPEAPGSRAGSRAGSTAGSTPGSPPGASAGSTAGDTGQAAALVEPPVDDGTTLLIDFR